MKRLLSAVVAALLMLPAMAQNITGTWTNTEALRQAADNGSSTGTATNYLTFNPDGTFRQDGTLVVALSAKGENFHVTVAYTGSGKWAQRVETLSLQYDPKKATVEVTECDFPGFVKKTFANSVKKALKKSLSGKKPMDLLIVSLTDDELVLLPLGKKDPQPEVYKRK